MDELTKQEELTRTLIESKKAESPTESLSKNVSCAGAVQLSPIVLKPTSSRTLLKGQGNYLISEALKKIKLVNEKVIEIGKIWVKVPNEKIECEVK